MGSELYGNSENIVGFDSGPGSEIGGNSENITGFDGDAPAPDAADQQKTDATNAKADEKAQGQNKRCSGGKCGTEVPGQCCEWMSKFNIACQKAMRPYSNSCGSCGGSGDKGGGPCQACDGTGIENSTGGGLNQPVTLVRLEYITKMEQLDVYAKKWGFITIERMEELIGVDFEHRWKFHFTPYINKVYKSVSLDTLNSYYKYQGYIVTMIQTLTNRQDPLIFDRELTLDEAEKAFTINSYPFVYKKSELVPIYYFDEIFYALQSDIREEFPGEDF